MITATPRSVLRLESGVGVHTAWVGTFGKGAPNTPMVKAVIDAGFGLIRDRWVPASKQQQAWFTALTDAGVGLWLTIGDMGYTPEKAAAEVGLLATTPLAPHVRFVAGPNEWNSSGNPGAAVKVTAIQQAIDAAVRAAPTLAKAQLVTAAAKHNVKDYAGDLAAAASAGLQHAADVVDVHFYSGNDGPGRRVQSQGGANVTVEQYEISTVADAYNATLVAHSEHGYTGADTDPQLAGRRTVETFLRDHLLGVEASLVYCLCDMPEVAGREGQFGVVKADGTPKPAWTMIRDLLATPDGGKNMPGHVDVREEDATDAQVVVTSEPDGWTVYLLRETATTATIVLPKGSGLVCDIGTHSIGDAGNDRWLIELDDTMVIAHVSPAG